MFIAAASGRLLSIFESNTNSLLAEMNVNSVRTMCFSHDATKLALGFASGLKIMDLKNVINAMGGGTSPSVRKLGQEDSLAYCQLGQSPRENIPMDLHFSPSSDSLVALYPTEVIFWVVETGGCTRRVEIGFSVDLGVVSRNDDFVIVSQRLKAHDKRFVLKLIPLFGDCNKLSSSSHVLLQGHSEEGIKHIELSPCNDSLLTVGTQDHKILIWSVPALMAHAQHIINKTAMTVIARESSTIFSITERASVQNACFACGSSRVVYYTVACKLNVWDIASKVHINNIRVGTSIITWIAMNPAGDSVAVAQADGKVRVWDTSTGLQVGAKMKPSTVLSLNYVCYSPDMMVLM